MCERNVALEGRVAFDENVLSFCNYSSIVLTFGCFLSTVLALLRFCTDLSFRIILQVFKNICVKLDVNYVSAET